MFDFVSLTVLFSRRMLTVMNSANVSRVSGLTVISAFFSENELVSVPVGIVEVAGSNPPPSTSFPIKRLFFQLFLNLESIHFSDHVLKIAYAQ